MTQKKLFIFGIGGVANAVISNLRSSNEGWDVAGTVRDEAKIAPLRDGGINAFIFDYEKCEIDEEIETIVRESSHILITIPPNGDGCLVAPWLRKNIMNGHKDNNLQWLGYCSSTGVYGDAYGKWVDETTPPSPVSESGKRRLKAELQWQEMLNGHSEGAHIFRIGGIYGVGRNALLRVKNGNARNIYAPEHFISRIHEEDIAQGVIASMRNPSPEGDIYNLVDDMPTAGHVPIEYAAQLLGVVPPARVPLAEAELSEFAKGMYRANKRVSSQYIQEKLGVSWYYKSYKEGLDACLRHFLADGA